MSDLHQMVKKIRDSVSIGQVWKLKCDIYESYVYVSDIENDIFCVHYIKLNDYDIVSGPVDILDFYDMYEWVSG